MNWFQKAQAIIIVVSGLVLVLTILYDLQHWLRHGERDDVDLDAVPYLDRQGKLHGPETEDNDEEGEDGA